MVLHCCPELFHLLPGELASPNCLVPLSQSPVMNCEVSKLNFKIYSMQTNSLFSGLHGAEIRGWEGAGDLCSGPREVKGDHNGSKEVWRNHLPAAVGW